MSLQEILQWGGGSLLLLLTLIQITPIKINPWSWLLKCLGRALNAEVSDEIKGIKEYNQKLAEEIKSVRELEERDQKEDSSRLDSLEKVQQEFQQYYRQDDVKDARRRILRFADELRRGDKHSEEFFDDILEDVTEYKNYCADHPKFKNSKAVSSIKFIEDTYTKKLTEDDFL